MSAILAADGSPARPATAAPRASRGARRPVARSWHDVYEAANRADFRGYFWLPTLNPAEQLHSMTRSALAERSDFLYKNVGAVTMLIDRLSLAEVGTGTWPKWVTGQEDYDKLATDTYHFANHDPRVFSADAQHDGYSVQYAIRRCIALYGDCFGQLLRPNPGALHPQMLLIPGWQCDNEGAEKEASGWQDGVRTNEIGRPLEYKFLSGRGKDRKVTVVPAEDVLHFHDPFLPGQRRGAPCLAAVAKKLFRREDIQRALANGTLARERLGFAIESAGDDTGGPRVEMPGETETVENSDGTSYTLRRIFGESASEEVEIPELPPGMTLKTVESNRPGTAVMEFQDSILREAAWARKYPSEFVFFYAGVGQGTVARGVQIAAGEVIISAREFQMRPQFCLRHPVFWIWQLIRAGFFEARNVAVPENWWQTKTIHPALPTVDVGREGRLYDGRVATGLMSIESYHGMAGEDASDVEDENLAAIRRRLRKLKLLNDDAAQNGLPPLTYADVWARNTNVPVDLPGAAGKPLDPAEE